MLQECVGDHRHERVAMKPLPRSALEVIEAEFLFQLLMGLFANPSRLDGRGEGFEVGLGGQVREIVFSLARDAMFADEPGLLARHVLLSLVPDPLGRSIGDAHTNSGEAGFQRPFRSPAPTHLPPFRFSQHGFSMDGRAVGHMPLTRPTPPRNREYEFDRARIDLLMARNADRPSEPTRAQSLTEGRRETIARIGENGAEGEARRDCAINFGKCDLGLRARFSIGFRHASPIQPI